MSQRNKENSPPLKDIKLHHLGIVVSDLDQAVLYYEKHLGLTRVSVSEWTTIPGKPLGLDSSDVKLRWAFMKLGTNTIEIHEFEDTAPARATNQPGVGHIALTVPDIHAAHQTLSQAGLQFHSEPNLLNMPGQEGDFWVYGTDPFGVTIELYQQAERPKHND